MINNIIILKIATVISTLIPFNLVLFKFYNTIFGKYQNNLSKTTAICTNINQTLTKELLTAKSIYFDKYEALIKKESKYIYLTDKETRKEKKLEKPELAKNDLINIIGTITNYCHYPKIHKLEAIISSFLKECEIITSKYNYIYNKISEIPSNEEKKISTVVLQKKETNEIFAFSKGNPYKILDKCSRISKNGKNIDLDQSLKRKLKNKIKQLNDEGEKIIAFAYRPLPLKKLDNYSEEFTETNLVWVGMIGLGHEIKDELIPLFEEIKNLGVKTYIISGAKKTKATSIGEKLKILNTKYFEALNSEDLEEIDKEQLSKILLNKKKDFLFYRIKKEDKKKIINALKDNGETVTIAKVNQKNSIKTIYERLIKGEQESQNKPRNHFHAFSLKIAEFILVVVSIIFNAPLPLTIPLIIALDIFINTILEITISEENEVIKKEKIIPLSIFNGIMTGTLLSIIYFYYLMSLGWYPGETLSNNAEIIIKTNSLIFLALGINQIINAYIIKNPEKSFLKLNYKNNSSLILGSFVAILILYILYNFEKVREILFLGELTNVNIPILLFITLTLIILDELRKFLIPRNEGKAKK